MLNASFSASLMCNLSSTMNLKFEGDLFLSYTRLREDSGQKKVAVGTLHIKVTANKSDHGGFSSHGRGLLSGTSASQVEIRDER